MLTEFKKTPHAVLRYGFDLRKWLAPEDFVVSATAELVENESTVELAEAEPVIDESATAVTIQLRGGDPGEKVRVRLAWTTSIGDIDARTFLVAVQDR